MKVYILVKRTYVPVDSIEGVFTDESVANAAHDKACNHQFMRKFLEDYSLEEFTPVTKEDMEKMG